MDEGRILYVRGIGRAISKEDLIIYFQSRKQSGGGDISSVELKEGEAVITFEDSDGELCLHVVFINMFIRYHKTTSIYSSLFREIFQLETAT